MAAVHMKPRPFHVVCQQQRNAFFFRHRGQGTLTLVHANVVLQGGQSIHALFLTVMRTERYGQAHATVFLDFRASLKQVLTVGDEVQFCDNHTAFGTLQWSRAWEEAHDSLVPKTWRLPSSVADLRGGRLAPLQLLVAA